MDWQHFNDNETKDGVEGRWRFENPEHFIIYINGTDHKEDWKRNFRLNRVKITNDGVKVNQEDLAEGQWVTEFILSRITPETKTITIAGHSRGGATTQIAVYKLLKQLPATRIRGVLFASKRAGNHKFVKTITDSCSAYVHRGDIVTWIPPFWPFYWNVKPNKFGKWKPVWIAHMPYQFNELKDRYQLR